METVGVPHLPQRGGINQIDVFAHQALKGALRALFHELPQPLDVLGHTVSTQSNRRPAGSGNRAKDVELAKSPW